MREPSGPPSVHPAPACVARPMTAWIDAPASDCEHEPDWLGVKCQHCGIPAEMVPPDELAEHLSAALDTAYEADRYVGSIRNDLKREYARAYLAFLRAPGPALGPERPRGLSYMAAQAVRMTLARTWQP